VRGAAGTQTSHLSTNLVPAHISSWTLRPCPCCAALASVREASEPAQPIAPQCSQTNSSIYTMRTASWAIELECFLRQVERADNGFARFAPRARPLYDVNSWPQAYTWIVTSQGNAVQITSSAQACKCSKALLQDLPKASWFMVA
jgi:hypothetical protein